MTERPDDLPGLMRSMEDHLISISAGIAVLKAVATAHDEVPHYQVEFVAEGIDRCERELRELLDLAERLSRRAVAA